MFLNGYEKKYSVVEYLYKITGTPSTVMPENFQIPFNPNSMDFWKVNGGLHNLIKTINPRPSYVDINYIIYLLKEMAANSPDSFVSDLEDLIGVLDATKTSLSISHKNSSHYNGQVFPPVMSNISTPPVVTQSRLPVFTQPKPKHQSAVYYSSDSVSGTGNVSQSMSYSNSGKLGSNTLMQASQMMSASNIPAISPYSFNQSSYQMSPSSYVVPQSTYNMPDQPSIPNYQSLPSGFPPPSYRVNPY